MILFSVWNGMAAAAPVSKIDGAAYLPLETLARENGLAYQYDPILKNALLTGPKGIFKTHVGAEFAWDGRRLIRLERKVCLSDGAVMVPESALEYLMPAPTPAPEPAVVSRPIRIVIDAGHGGHDFGAISRGLAEKRVVLEVARGVWQELEKAGFRVRMTRKGDEFIPLEGRVRVAGDDDADFFVSIHANASLSKSLKGFETYYLSEKADDEFLAQNRAGHEPFRSETAKFDLRNNELKAVVWDLKQEDNRRRSVNLAETIGRSVERSVSISNRRFRSAEFFVLKWTDCPAVLVEMGYLTNDEDEKNLKQPSYRRQMAHAIAEGIIQYAGRAR